MQKALILGETFYFSFFEIVEDFFYYTFFFQPVILALIAVASATFCCSNDAIRKKPPQKSVVERKDIRNIVQQLERINKIAWKALENNRYLKSKRIMFAGFETNIIYIVRLFNRLNQHNWKEYQTLLERRRLSVNEQGMNRGKELTIIRVIQELEVASETIWKTLGKLLLNNGNNL